MKPQLGDPVIVVGPNSNGATEHPGLISRVWPERLHDNGMVQEVNLHCFRDANSSLPLTSVGFYSSLPEANARQAKLPFCYPKPAKEA